MTLKFGSVKFMTGMYQAFVRFEKACYVILRTSFVQNVIFSKGKTMTTDLLKASFNNDIHEMLNWAAYNILLSDRHAAPGFVSSTLYLCICISITNLSCLSVCLSVSH